jgi:hypothetical protein
MKLFAVLQKGRHDHMVLSSNGTLHAKPGVQNSNFVASSTLVTPKQFPSSLPARERVLMDACVTKHRLSRQVADERDMFLALVWMTAPERTSLFRKFPHEKIQQNSRIGRGIFLMNRTVSTERRHRRKSALHQDTLNTWHAM